jgi:hypothetical protein
MKKSARELLAQEAEGSLPNRESLGSLHERIRAQSRDFDETSGTELFAQLSGLYGNSKSAPTAGSATPGSGSNSVISNPFKFEDIDEYDRIIQEEQENGYFINPNDLLINDEKAGLAYKKMQELLAKRMKGEVKYIPMENEAEKDRAYFTTDYLRNLASANAKKSKAKKSASSSTSTTSSSSSSSDSSSTVGSVVKRSKSKLDRDSPEYRKLARKFAIRRPK